MGDNWEIVSILILMDYLFLPSRGTALHDLACKLVSILILMDYLFLQLKGHDFKKAGVKSQSLF